MLIVETVADDKLVRDHEAAVIRRDLAFAALGLVEEAAGADRGRITAVL